LKIEEYLQTLPQEIISGEDVQLPDHSFREIFEFASLGKDDTFYHLGCGDGNGIQIALEEFQVKKAIGIDNDPKKITIANQLLKNKNLKGNLICENILDSEINDATVILFWFTDFSIIEKMIHSIT